MIHRFVLACLAVFLGGSCAHRMPLPEALRVADAPALIARMQASRATVNGYSAEARLSYFGASGRFKGTASLVTLRPDKLRYELLGPHGGVIWAVASDGKTLTVLDMQHGTFDHAAATPENLDRLLKLVPLGLPTAGWVALLFGEVDVPPTAQLDYDDSQGTYVLHWPGASAGQVIHLAVAPESGRMVAATVSVGNQVSSEVRIESRFANGLPQVLHMRVVDPEAELEVRLRDVSTDPQLDPAVFLLTPP